MSLAGNRATGQDLVAMALRLLNVRAAGNPLTADEGIDGLIAANQMLDAWKLEGLTAYASKRVAKTLTVGKASYTIGTGGEINEVRPVSISYAGLVLDPAATTPDEWPIAVYTLQEWVGIRMKTMPGQPAGVFLDRTWSAGLANLYTYPVSDVAGRQLVLYLPVLLADFADLTTAYTFPPGYMLALKTNLALALAPEYAVDADTFARIRAMAIQSKAAVKRGNQFEQPEIGCDQAVLSFGGGTMTRSAFERGD